MHLRRTVILSVRVFTFAALAGAAFRIPLPMPAPPVLRCCVLDLSGSIYWGRQTDGEPLVALLSEEVSQGSPDDRYALVAFAGAPRLLRPPSPPSAFLQFLRDELRPLLTRDALTEASRRDLQPERTRIEDALDLARGLRDGVRPLHIVLLTDGAETSGDALRAAALLRHDGIPLAVVPLGPRSPPDVRLDAVRAPRTVPPDAAWDLEAELTSSVSSTVRVEVRRDGIALAVRELPVPADARTRIVFSGLTLASAADTLEVVIVPPPDQDLCDENNRLSVEVAREKPGTRRVLYVSGVPGPRSLQSLLSANARYDVVSGGPGVGTAGPCDLVVLDDIRWEEVPASLRSSLPESILHLGTGLLLAGGPNGLARGDYARSDIEPLLPVRSLPDERLGLAVVLDRSGSMGETAVGRTRKIDAARDALRRVLRLLHPEDRLAFLAFPGMDDAPVQVIRSAQPPPSEAAFNEMLRSLDTRGGTRFEPPLAESIRLLAAADTGLRHILMVTDGETAEPPGALAGVGAGLRDRGITLTIVVTGKHPSEKALLSLLPDARSGRQVVLDDWSMLESIVEEDIRRTKAWVVTGPIEISAAADSPLLSGVPSPPPLAAANRTTPRPEGRILLQGPRGLPVLAVRQAGAGRTAVLATTLDDPAWGGSWLAWDPHASELVGRLADHLSGGIPSAVELDALAQEDTIRITAEWRDPLPASPPPSLWAIVRLPVGGEATIQLARVDAARYEGELAAPMPGRYAVRVEEPPQGGVSGRAVGALVLRVPYAQEWRSPGRRHAFLQRIARAAGGRVVESLADLRAARPAGFHPRQSFFAYASAALALLLCDLAIGAFWHERASRARA